MDDTPYWQIGSGYRVKIEVERGELGWKFAGRLFEDLFDEEREERLDSPEVGVLEGIITNWLDFDEACYTYSHVLDVMACKAKERPDEGDEFWRQVTVTRLYISPDHRGKRLSYFLAKEVMCLLDDLMSGIAHALYVVAYPTEGKLTQRAVNRLEKYWTEFGLYRLKGKLVHHENVKLHILDYCFECAFPEGSFMANFQS